MKSPGQPRGGETPPIASPSGRPNARHRWALGRPDGEVAAGGGNSGLTRKLHLCRKSLCRWGILIPNLDGRLGRERAYARRAARQRDMRHNSLLYRQLRHRCNFLVSPELRFWQQSLRPAGPPRGIAAGRAGGTERCLVMFRLLGAHAPSFTISSLRDFGQPPAQEARQFACRTWPTRIL